MSILRSIIDSVRTSFSNEAFDQVKAREMHDHIIKAIHEASADGTITAEEMAEIKELAGKIEIEERELNHIKLDVLKDLVTQIKADQKVTADEIALLKEVEDSFTIADEEKARLETDIAEVKRMYQES